MLLVIYPQELLLWKEVGAHGDLPRAVRPAGPSSGDTRCLLQRVRWCRAQRRDLWAGKRPKKKKINV